MTEILAIIPARGGSKRIPRKNVLDLCGKPVIAYSIEAALNSGVVSRVIVSTDDEEIAQVARQWGAEAPFLRPAALAQDNIPGIAPVIHAVYWLGEQKGYRPEYVMLLQPTSPLRTAEDIRATVEIAQEKNADAVVSVCRTDHHPYWTKRITEDGCLVDFLPLDHASSQSKDLPVVHALNGAIYLVKRPVLLEQETFYTSNTYAYVMPEERSLDIDTPWQLYLAELVLKDELSRA